MAATDQEVKTLAESVKTNPLQKSYSMPHLLNPTPVHRRHPSSQASNNNDPDTHTPSCHSSQGSSAHSESQTPLFPLTPFNREKAPSTIAALPANPPGGKIPKGKLIAAWIGFFMKQQRETEQKHQAESAKLQAENTALLERVRVLEENFAQLQREHQVSEQQKREYFSAWQNALAASPRGPQLNLNNLPSSQSSSATSTPSSTTTTETNTSTASPKETHTQASAPAPGPSLLATICFCFKC